MSSSFSLSDSSFLGHLFETNLSENKLHKVTAAEISASIGGDAELEEGSVFIAVEGLVIDENVLLG